MDKINKMNHGETYKEGDRLQSFATTSNQKSRDTKTEDCKMNTNDRQYTGYQTRDKIDRINDEKHKLENIERERRLEIWK